MSLVKSWPCKERRLACFYVESLQHARSRCNRRAWEYLDCCYRQREYRSTQLRATGAKHYCCKHPDAIMQGCAHGLGRDTAELVVVGEVSDCSIDND